MKNCLIYCFLIFFLNSCNWNKPKPGKYVMEVTGTIHNPTYGDSPFNYSYYIDISQSRLNHITITTVCPDYPNDASILNKKGSKVKGTFSYKCGGLGAASKDTYRLDGKIISGNNHNVITGNFTGDYEYSGSSGYQFYSNYYEGTFKISPKQW